MGPPPLGVAGTGDLGTTGDYGGCSSNGWVQGVRRAGLPGHACLSGGLAQGPWPPPIGGGIHSREALPGECIVPLPVP